MGTGRKNLGKCANATVGRLERYVDANSGLSDKWLRPDLTGGRDGKLDLWAKHCGVSYFAIRANRTEDPKEEERKGSMDSDLLSEKKPDNPLRRKKLSAT